MTTRITIRRPDDWHLHVRDGEMLKAVLPFTAAHFGRAILMPNLIPPVRTTADAVAYRERVTKADRALSERRFGIFEAFAGKTMRLDGAGRPIKVDHQANVAE